MTVVTLGSLTKTPTPIGLRPIDPPPKGEGKERALPSPSPPQRRVIRRQIGINHQIDRLLGRAVDIDPAAVHFLDGGADGVLLGQGTQYSQHRIYSLFSP